MAKPGSDQALRSISMVAGLENTRISCGGRAQLAARTPSAASGCSTARPSFLRRGSLFCEHAHKPALGSGVLPMSPGTLPLKGVEKRVLDVDRRKA